MTLLSAAVPTAALPPAAVCTHSASLVVWVVRVSVRIHLALHPPVLDCRCTPSPVAELLEAPDVVVAVNKLVDGVEGESVRPLGPEVPECAEVPLRCRRGGANREGTKGDLLQLRPPAPVKLPPSAGET